MNESQNPNQQSGTDPCGGAKSSDPPQKDPCDDPNPKPPEKPKDPERPPCPPPDPKCPEKKDCPKLPEQPKDPCVPAPQGGGSSGGGTGDPGQQVPQQGDPSQTIGQSGTSGTANCGGSGSGAGQGGSSGGSGGGSKGGGAGANTPNDTIAAQLERLKNDLKTGQDKVLELEPLKASIGDITQRIQALEKMMDGQAAAASGYKDFFRSIEVSKSEVDCFIPTVRCQLELTATQKQCICDAIKAVDTRVDAAKAASDKANHDVEKAEKDYKHAADTLSWIKKWYEFLKSGLQQQVAKVRDDLKTLKGLADPSKNQCEVWFYLYELERLIKSTYGSQGACWRADINVGTFLECWRWDCYEQVWNTAVVKFNEAEADEKLKKSRLEQAKKNAGELEKSAKEAESKRREWILKEIKTRDCCGPLSKCPDPKGQGQVQAQGRVL